MSRTVTPGPLEMISLQELRGLALRATGTHGPTLLRRLVTELEIWK